MAPGWPCGSREQSWPQAPAEIELAGFLVGARVCPEACTGDLISSPAHTYPPHEWCTEEESESQSGEASHLRAPAPISQCACLPISCP